MGAINRNLYKSPNYRVTMENKTVFLEIFGESPILKVMDFLVVNEEFDYSMVNIAKLSGVGYATLKLFWNKLEKNKIVTKTRNVGRAKMYKLNRNNPITSKFVEFYWSITKQSIRKELGKEITV
jgi:hypothetical protein